MKFAALALTLLLAVGSHGDVWPGSYAKDMILRAQAMVDRITEPLKDGEFAEKVQEMKQLVSIASTSVIGFLDSDDARSFYDGAQTRFGEIINKPQTLQARAQIMQRAGEYKTMIDDYVESHREDFSSLISKLKETFISNREETARLLFNAADEMKEEFRGSMENLREMATPYTHEYREHIKALVTKVQESNFAEIITPKVLEIHGKFREILNDIYNAFNQQ